MGKIIYLNNFECPFIDAVKDVPTTGTPDTELNYGILRLNNTASGVLVNPTGGDYYLLTAFKRSGGAESAFEVMKVTEVDITTYPGECRIKVDRAQEGTSAKAYVTGDLVQLRWTKGSAEAVVQRDATETLTNKTLNTPVLANPSYSGTTANGGTVTTIDINGGTIDGAAIGASSASSGAFTTVESSGSMLVKGAALLGYGVGAGGTAVQPVNNTGTVTLNKPTGKITTSGAFFTSYNTYVFTFNNSFITPATMLYLSVPGQPDFVVKTQAFNGYATVSLMNNGPSSVYGSVDCYFNIFSTSTS